MKRQIIIFAIMLLMLIAGILGFLTSAEGFYLSVNQIIAVTLGMAVFGIILTKEGA